SVVVAIDPDHRAVREADVDVGLETTVEGHFPDDLPATAIDVGVLQMATGAAGGLADRGDQADLGLARQSGLFGTPGPAALDHLAAVSADQYLARTPLGAGQLHLPDAPAAEPLPLDVIGAPANRAARGANGPDRRVD